MSIAGSCPVLINARTLSGLHCQRAANCFGVNLVRSATILQQSHPLPLHSRLPTTLHRFTPGLPSAISFCVLRKSPAMLHAAIDPPRPVAASLP